MKKMTTFFLALLFLVSLTYALLQSDLGKNFIRAKITETLSKAGFEAQIGEVAGTLPNEIQLKNISIQGDGLDLKVQSLSLRPILWRFIQGEIAFKEIKAKGLVFSDKSPLNFEGKFWMTEKNAFIAGDINGWSLKAHLNRQERFLQFTVKNALAIAKGHAHINANYQLENGQIQFGSDQIFSKVNPELSGKFLARLEFVREQDMLKGDLNWQIPYLRFQRSDLGAFQGKGSGALKGDVLTGELFNDFSHITFDWTLNPNNLIAGKNEITIDNLQVLHLPDTYGTLQADLILSIEEGKQALQINGELTDFYYKEFFSEKTFFSTDLNQFNVHITGKYDLEIDGFFSKNHVHINTLNGKISDHPIALQKPIDLKWTKDALDLSLTELQVENGSILLEIHKNSAELTLNQLPLDLLSLDVPTNGLLDLKAEFNNQKGSIEASLSQMGPCFTSGTLSGSFNQDQLHLQGHLAPFLELNGTIPIHFSLSPFKVELLAHKETTGYLTFDGPIEELVDLLNLGPHRLEGRIQGELSLKNTLSHPIVEGHAIFKEGSYENYYTGTHLRNIQADFIAKGDTVTLLSFTAVDEPGDGAIDATGEILLKPLDLYPFHFNVHLDDFQFTGVDLVKASANGQIHIEGNTSSSLATGELLITESSLTIPDHIPLPLAELNVTYINQDRPIPQSTTTFTPYPLYLDLQVKAPKVEISGRGLTSTWKGDFHVGGSVTSIATQGDLKLIDGRFNFSSKEFALYSGALSFSGVEGEMPKINITGGMDVQGIAITVQLHGSLDNPQIALQSNPPLPLSSIMSHLLFGQDISEISGFQAFELASSLASLAGTGPDIMENTRKSLGVDRLRVIADPDNGETIAFEVGKYISKGVLVTLTQGVQQSSTNIRIEVELKGRLILQLESDQHQEQGKFTLKWQVNY